MKKEGYIGPYEESQRCGPGSFCVLSSEQLPFLPAQNCQLGGQDLPGTNHKRLGYTRLEFKPDHINQQLIANWTMLLLYGL